MPGATFGVQILPPDAGASGYPREDTDECACDQLRPGERRSIRANKLQSPSFHTQRAMLQTPRDGEIGDSKRKVVGQVNNVGDAVIGRNGTAVDQNRWEAREQANGKHAE